MQIGFLGLGKMGSRMVEKLLSDGHKVFVWNRSSEVTQELVSQLNLPNLKGFDNVSELISSLDKPRLLWIMVSPQGVDDVLAEVKKFLSPGDIVVDGGNSFYKDTQKRFEDFRKERVHFLGIGTSGGILAIENGYPFMVGGSKEGYEKIIPILDSLAKPNGGHEYFGEGGAGHFVKMVHNGIEYGIMQSLGEGFEVLEKSKYDFDLLKIAKLWQKGSIVSGFLLDRARGALEKPKDLEETIGIISASGEAEWTVEAAKEEGVEVEIIERSLDYRKRSAEDKKIQLSFTAKLVASLRREFGGHEVKKSE